MEARTRATVTRYDPARTLRLGAELTRQVRRRRTHLAFGMTVALPVFAGVAFRVGGGVGAGTGYDTSGAPQVVALATSSGMNFALFMEFVSAGFLSVVFAAIFAGDTVASEASWSTLRYLLAAPVPRARLLRQKLGGAAVQIIVANLLMPAASLLVGGTLSGFGPTRTPPGIVLGLTASAVRLLIIVGYLCIQLFAAAALAFLIGVCVDNPLAAVGGAVLFTVIGNILDQITALGPVRLLLPAHWDYAWVDTLSAPIRFDDMIRGTGVGLTYIAVLTGAAFLIFTRKDITS